MHPIALLAGLLLIASVLADAFGTMILPRRISGRWRFTRLFYRFTWPLWRWAPGRMARGRRRETLLSWFGPLSLLTLIALWALGLVFGFALIFWSFDSPFRGIFSGPFAADLYASGGTFFTLGAGDLVPSTTWARALTVVEGGMGFGFLAVIIGYLPVLYAAFSRREADIALLDARAGSPPSAGELLRRHGRDNSCDELLAFLVRWERWSAEVLESQVSYPILGLFRSQHVNQSWLAALTSVLDASALLVAAGPPEAQRQARLTFAMARHAVVDLAQAFVGNLPPHLPDRLPPADRDRLFDMLRDAGMTLRDDDASRAKLLKLRGLYEAPAQATAAATMLDLPSWIGNAEALDNWQRSPWNKGRAIDEIHF